MSGGQDEVEMMGQSNHTRRSSSLGQSNRLPDRSSSELRKSRGDCWVSTECGDDFRGKCTIFELTDMVKTASCRAYPDKLWGLSKSLGRKPRTTDLLDF